MADDAGMQINVTKAWGLARDGLAMLVLPLLLWGVKLEVGNAERDLLIENQKVEVTRLEKRVESNSNIDDKVHALALKQATLEGKLDTANGRLSEIKDLLR